MKQVLMLSVKKIKNETMVFKHVIKYDEDKLN